MTRLEELTNEQWAIAKLQFQNHCAVPPGGPPLRDARKVLNGILWILRSGARWQDLLECFQPDQTCHQCFQQWVRDDTLRRIPETLAADLREHGELDLSACCIDAAFVVAKQGARVWERPSVARV
jgi:transposase